MRSFSRYTVATIIFLSSAIGVAGSAANASELPKAHAYTAATTLPATPRLHPRMAQVTAELNRIDYRIHRDFKRGYLSASEMQAVKRDANVIRTQAWRTAQNHHGMMPRLAFVKIQGQVRQLDGTIHKFGGVKA